MDKKDYRNTKIRIHSPEHFRYVQEVLFEAGCSWGGSKDLHTRDVVYVAVDKSLNIHWGQILSYFELNGRDEVVIPERVGHIHAKLMEQYAEDAKTNMEPWKLWEMNFKEDPTPNWSECSECIEWSTYMVYRRKPKMKLIHGIRVPDISFVPDVGSEFYIPNIGLPNYLEVGSRSSERCSFTLRMVERDLCYPHTEEGKQASILHAKAMLGIA